MDCKLTLKLDQILKNDAKMWVRVIKEKMTKSVTII